MVSSTQVPDLLAERLLALWERTGLDSLRRLANGLVPFPEHDRVEVASAAAPEALPDSAQTAQHPKSEQHAPGLPRYSVLDETGFNDWLGTALMDAYQQSGDREVLTMLFETHESLFRRRLRFQIRRLGARIELDDVLQESLLNVMRYPHRFSVEKADSFRVWVSTILRNTVLKQLRSHSRANRLASLDADHGDESAGVCDPRAQTPLRRVTDSESARTVDRAFLLWLTLYHAQYRELTEKEQFALSRVEVDQWSYREVAEALEIKVENLKMVIFRARRKIVRGLTETLATMASTATRSSSISSASTISSVGA